MRGFALPGQAVLLLTAREIRQRTTGSVLGWGWLVIQPAFLLAIYTFVFGVVLQVRFVPGGDTLGFALYLMAGLMPYTAFRESVERGANSLTSNRQLLQRVLTPPAVFPVVVTLSSVVTEAIGLGLLLVAVLLLGGGLSFWVLLLPLLILCRLLLSLAVAWLVSTLTVFLRDLGQLLNLLLTLLFFATPILYPVSQVPEGYSLVFELNPFYHLVSAYRAVILEGAAPPAGFYVVLAGAVVLLLLSRRFFDATVDRAKDLL